MEEGGVGEDLNLVTLLAIIILMIYTVSAPIFEKIHFHYMHESGLCMIIGVIVSLIAIFLTLIQISQNQLILVVKYFLHLFYLLLYLVQDIIYIVLLFLNILFIL